MSTGYNRADTVNNIADGNIINASDLDAEYDAIAAAFAEVTGHTHDGSDGEGAPITKIGPAQDIVVSTSGAVPKTNNTVDLGSATFQYKNIYIDGTAFIDTLEIDGTVVTSTAAELNILDGVTSTAAELNVLDGITASTAELNLLDGVTSSTAELNLLDGVTASTAEINFIDGVTSNIQTQLNAKQPLDAQLTDIAGLTPTDNAVIIGNGTNFVAESGATARASLGLAIGTDVQAFDADLTTLGAGGSAARAFLGLTIGTDVQAYDPELAALSGLTPTDNAIIVGNGTTFVTESGATARASLGLTIGTNVQAYDAQLADIAGLTPTDNGIVIGNGTNFVVETGATARTSLGLAIGTDVQAYDADLTTLGAGGSAARSFLGLAIGTDVQAFDQQLSDVAGLTPTDNGVIIGNGTNFVLESGATLRTSLGLAIGTDVQAYDADLAAFAGKTAPSGAVVGTSDSQTLTNKTIDGASNTLTNLSLASITEPVRHSVRPSLLLDFANTKTLDHRITFTRASTGTFYDGKTTAKAEENLLTYSEQFDDASWTKTNTSITANSTASPDGTTTSDTLTASAGTAQHFSQKSITLSAGTYTLSVYAKAGTNNFIQLTLGEQTSYANFDLSTGTVGQTVGVDSSSITASLNGFYRCTVTLTIASGTAAIVAITNSSTSARLNSWAAAGTETVYLWGAQLEQRSSVTAYTPTTTAPITNYIPALQTAAAGVARFEHNPATGESLGLEIEEQRTNLLTYSDDFNNAAWTKTAASITSNTIIAPDGTLAGDKLVEDTATNNHDLRRDISLTTGTAYAYSIFAKAGERTRFAVVFGSGAFGVNVRVDFDLSAITSTTIVAGTNTLSSITSVGNGWYRCTVISTTTATATAITLLRLVQTSTVTNYTGDGWSGIYIWGAQLEAGAFATSYIPTVASQVTRSADAASMTGTNFSSWYRADEGTLYATYTQANNTVASQVASLNDNTNGNRISIRSGVNPDLLIQTSSVTQAQVSASTGSANTLVKAAGVYKVNDAQVSFNGLLSANDSSLTLPIVNQLTIGSITSTSFVNGSINKIAYYPKRLTNEELQGLTTV